MAGLARAKTHGTRIGRPRATPLPTNAALALRCVRRLLRGGCRSRRPRGVSGQVPTPDVGQPYAIPA